MNHGSLRVAVLISGTGSKLKALVGAMDTRAIEVGMVLAIGYYTDDVQLKFTGFNGINKRFQITAGTGNQYGNSQWFMSGHN